MAPTKRSAQAPPPPPPSSYRLPTTAAGLSARWAATYDARGPVVGFYGHRLGAKHSCFSNFFEHEPIPFEIPRCCLPPASPLAARVPPGGAPLVVTVAFAEKSIMLCKAAVMGDPASFDAIAAADTPARVKVLGRGVEPWNQAKWSEVVCTVAAEAALQKFAQLPDLRRQLLDTGDALLAEATRGDSIWGIGLNVGQPEVQHPRQWRGSNILGFALMSARAALRPPGAGLAAGAAAWADGGAQPGSNSEQFG